jgi:hypothetical protein
LSINFCANPKENSSFLRWDEKPEAIIIAFYKATFVDARLALAFVDGLGEAYKIKQYKTHFVLAVIGTVNRP